MIKMRKMKDSGIAWIGEIPEDWEVLRGKNIFKQRSEKGNSICLQLLSPSQKYGVIPQELYEKLSGMRPVKLNEKVDLSQFKTVHIGDYCISLRSFQGGFEYSDYEGVVSTVYQIFYPKLEVYRGYYKYLFKDKGFISEMNSYTLTLRDGKNIAFEDFGNSILPYPSTIEQQQIADFLDKKCAEIDKLIELQESMIEKLKEYKQSVITQAVTKGLDPDVPMKDSGIEWIGKIPEGWRIAETKSIFNIYTGATPKSDYEEFWDGDINWITPADYKTQDVFVSCGKRKISEKGLNSCSTYLIPAGGLIFSKRAPIGSVAIAQNELCTNQGCLSCVAKLKIEIKYYYYLISTLTAIYELFGAGTTFKEISTNAFSSFKLVLPDFIEQQQIADYLDKKCAEIDDLINLKDQKIEKLKEYKKSLIYEYVTGKKEVV